MNIGNPNDTRSNIFVEKLYDIALEPEALSQFIDLWNSVGLDASHVRQTISKIDEFDRHFASHLDRANKFLERIDDEDDKSLENELARFGGSAAFVINEQLVIVALNTGARLVFGLRQGASLLDIPLAADALDALKDSVSTRSKADGRVSNMLKLTDEISGRTILFHTRRLQSPISGDFPHILIVSPQSFLGKALCETLTEIFELTEAELGVVRNLVGGNDIKAIAAIRGTSEGTVRIQIKSILAKMHAHSQAEIIRLVMSLRDVVAPSELPENNAISAPISVGARLQAEATKPFKTLILPDGRRLDYHDQGAPNGAPILFTHMGYGQLRWTSEMLSLAFRHQLRVICPIRAGYGMSSNVSASTDILAVNRSNTLHLLSHLGINRLPYVAQGSDLMFAVDFAGKHPEFVSEIVGICARPPLPGDRHYSRMGKWHRFFLSTAKHSPHLLNFTARAAFTLAQKIGVGQMFRNMHANSPADARILDDPRIAAIMEQSAEELLLGEGVDAAQAYAMELLISESDWSGLMYEARDVPSWSANGSEDPSMDASLLAEYREHFPWMSFEYIEDAGQMLIFQHPDKIIPRLAKAARAVMR